jgi:hypothetical protein
MTNYPECEQPITLSDSDELIAKLDNEALLTKFLSPVSPPWTPNSAASASNC